MNRIALIAGREFMAYARTVGFWLSLLSFPLFAVLGGMLPGLIKQAEPVREVAIIEEAPQASGLAEAVRKALAQRDFGQDVQAMTMASLTEAGLEGSRQIRRAAEDQGFDAGMAEMKRLAPKAAERFERPRRQVVVVETPQALAEAAPGAARDAVARRFVSDEVAKEERLSNVIILSEAGDTPTARVWARRTSDTTIENIVDQALRTVNRDRIFARNSIDPAIVTDTDAFRPEVTLFSPRAASGGEVGMKDRLPGLVGMVVGFMLWSVVITGASILLNSVMEEKANKILEVLLSSASPSEILAGKVLGVALLTLTVMVSWGLLGGITLAVALPDMAATVSSVLLGGGMVFYFLAFLVGGYLMYAVLFAAIGAFCETPRDAQTLMGPIMMALFVPLLVMQLAIRTPDAPLVKVVSLIPPFTPFVMAARVPSGLPLIEILASLVGMVLFTALIVWVAQRAFRAGALSDVKLSWKTFMGAVTGRF